MKPLFIYYMDELVSFSIHGYKRYMLNNKAIFNAIYLYPTTNTLQIVGSCEVNQPLI